jgi:hypothetical protein
VRRISEPLRRPRLEEYDDDARWLVQVGHPVVGPSQRVPGSVTRSGMSVGDEGDIVKTPTKSRTILANQIGRLRCERY